MENEKLIKIAIVGPESTGKSTTARQLAEQYDTIYVPEYAREYCRGLNREYTLEDEMNIFYGQLDLERKMAPLARHNLLFCDTMVLTVKVWCDHLFGSTPQPVRSSLTDQVYDFFLLMDIDLPWQDDELRDFPDLRDHFMSVWQKELKELNAKYTIVAGSGTKRFEHALKAVNLFLSTATL